MLSKLRRIAGKLKCKLVDEWPYASRMRQMPEIRERLRGSIRTLPKIEATGSIEYEIHMLCGHRDFDMGIWASWSLMRFLDSKAMLIVHSDGTLTNADIDEWQSVIRPIEVIGRDTADQRVKEALGGTKHLLKWRNTYKTSPQLIDAHLFGRNSSFLVMDSDVLVFSKPTELLNSVRENTFGWCLDLRDAYSASPTLLHEVTGIKMPNRFNCGMLATPRLTIADFEYLDGVLEKIKSDGRIDVNRYWACQTYYAMLASRRPESRPMPSEYTTKSGKTSSECILRHYVGVPSIRYRYFTEGVQRLLQDSASPARQ